MLQMVNKLHSIIHICLYTQLSITVYSHEKQDELTGCDNVCNNMYVKGNMVW